MPFSDLDMITVGAFAVALVLGWWLMSHWTRTSRSERHNAGPRPAARPSGTPRLTPVDGGRDAEDQPDAPSTDVGSESTGTSADRPR